MWNITDRNIVTGCMTLYFGGSTHKEMKMDRVKERVYVVALKKEK
jgi:hypothetical protein